MSRTAPYAYRFSFVMPVYNAGEYLAETIECVLAQTTGFKENVQLILVNDGSTDDSEQIAKVYQRRYPKNIIYIKQKNQGVSAARNAGMEKAEGKYISFLDSDDILSADATEKVFGFFEEHYNEIDVVSIKLEFFEGQTGAHPLNYKYHNTRVVNIRNEPSCIQLSGGASFVKTSAVKGIHKFNTHLQTAEDATFLTELILEKMAYGVVAEPTYYYRRRRDSAVSSSYSSKSWYLNTPQLFHQHIISLSLKKLGYVPKYVQHLLMYDLQWRFKQEVADNAPEGVDVEAYKQSLVSILRHIDDDVVMAQRNIRIEYKHFILRKKYGSEAFDRMVQRSDTKYYLRDVCIYDNKWKHKVLVDIVDIKGDRVSIRGRVSGLILDDAQFGFRVGGRFYGVNRIARADIALQSLGELVHDKNSFLVEFPIKNYEHVRTELRVSDWKKRIPIDGTRHSRMTPFKRGASYTVYKYFLLCHVEPSLLVFVRKSSYRVFTKELRYLAILVLSRIKHAPLHAIGISRSFLAKNKKKRMHTPSPPRSVKKSAPQAHQSAHRRRPMDMVVILRLMYWLTRPFVHKKVWLISDRVEAAGDNGEAFFRYVVTQPNHNIKPYFVLPKQSADYERLSEVGSVLDPSSWKYKILFLHADKVISSSADIHVIDVFNRKQPFIRDIIDFDFIFLQHGVTKDDQSNWLNRYIKNIKLLATVSPLERKSFLAKGYHYTKDDIILTGFPRYDLLDSHPKNKLIIMPTWRKDIVGMVDPETHERPYNPKFKITTYYQFYSKLLSDKRLLGALERNNMKAEFYIHPSLNKQKKDFKGSKNVKIMDFPHDYKKAFSEGSVLLTDYSSVAFDFAYLKKPVIYTQFDKKDFYAAHTYDEGYFSYEEDGFGPVTSDYESTIKRLVTALGGSGKLQPKYRERIDKFFKYVDKYNSRRVYQAVLSLDEESYVEAAVRQRKLIHTNNRTVSTYWWRYNHPIELNFGDEITPYILRSLWGLQAQWSEIDDSSLAGAGSIIEVLQRERTNKGLKVWGSGFIREGEKNENNNLDFYAVRGPESRARIRGTKGVALGDPGLLVNLIFRSAKTKKYKVGIVPHYVDVDSVLLNGIRNNPDYLIIDVLQTPDKVALDITACEYILSSSLHGLIFADSFNVPNNWLRLSDKLTGGEYKFRDYYESTGRELVEVAPSILGDKRQICRAAQSYKPIVDLDSMQQGLINSFPFGNRE